MANLCQAERGRGLHGVQAQCGPCPIPRAARQGRRSPFSLRTQIPDSANFLLGGTHGKTKFAICPIAGEARGSGSAQPRAGSQGATYHASPWFRPGTTAGYASPQHRLLFHDSEVELHSRKSIPDTPLRSKHEVLMPLPGCWWFSWAEGSTVPTRSSHPGPEEQNRTGAGVASHLRNHGSV